MILSQCSKSSTNSESNNRYDMKIPPPNPTKTAKRLMQHLHVAVPVFSVAALVVDIRRRLSRSNAIAARVRNGSTMSVRVIIADTAEVLQLLLGALHSMSCANETISCLFDS